MACKGHACYFLDSQTHRWTQAASGALILGPAHRKNSYELLISQEGTLPLIRKKKKKEKLIRWQKTLKILLLIRTVCPQSGIFSWQNVNCKVRVLFYTLSNQTNYL